MWGKARNLTNATPTPRTVDVVWGWMLCGTQLWDGKVEQIEEITLPTTTKHKTLCLFIKQRKTLFRYERNDRIDDRLRIAFSAGCNGDNVCNAREYENRTTVIGALISFLT